ncbi:MAG: pilus assembly protein N-terminal domain-containing protein [Pseudomonadota bacterium]
MALKPSAFASLAALTLLTAQTAKPPMQIELSKSEPMAFRGLIGSVVIGDPEVADVALLDDNTILVTGRGFGRTNLIVFDEFGGRLFQGDILVPSRGEGLVTLMRGETRTVLRCTDTCKE